jgi:hypothetical protein
MHAGALAAGMCAVSTHNGGSGRQAKSSSQGDVEVTKHWDKQRVSDVRMRQGRMLPRQDKMR